MMRNIENAIINRFGETELTSICIFFCTDKLEM